MKIYRKVIAVTGDSMSEFDGVGDPGYGRDRWLHSIWTRELSFQIDSENCSRDNRGPLLNNT